MTRRAAVVAVLVVAVLVAVDAACGGGSARTLSVRSAVRTVPTIAAKTLPTTTITPPTTAPRTTATPVPTAPPTTAAPQPAVDCLTVLNQANTATQQNLGRNATRAELAQVVTGVGRTDCLAAVDSYRPPYNPGPFLPNPLGPTVTTTPGTGPGCDIAHTVC